MSLNHFEAWKWCGAGVGWLSLCDIDVAAGTQAHNVIDIDLKAQCHISLFGGITSWTVDTAWSTLDHNGGDDILICYADQTLLLDLLENRCWIYNWQLFNINKTSDGNKMLEFL